MVIDWETSTFCWEGLDKRWEGPRTTWCSGNSLGWGGGRRSSRINESSSFQIAGSSGKGVRRRQETFFEVRDLHEGVWWLKILLIFTTGAYSWQESQSFRKQSLLANPLRWKRWTLFCDFESTHKGQKQRKVQDHVNSKTQKEEPFSQLKEMIASFPCVRFRLKITFNPHQEQTVLSKRIRKLPQSRLEGGVEKGRFIKEEITCCVLGLNCLSDCRKGTGGALRGYRREGRSGKEGAWGSLGRFCVERHRRATWGGAGWLGCLAALGNGLFSCSQSWAFCLGLGCSQR